MLKKNQLFTYVGLHIRQALLSMVTFYEYVQKWKYFLVTK